MNTALTRLAVLTNQPQRVDGYHSYKPENDFPGWELVAGYRIREPHKAATTWQGRDGLEHDSGSGADVDVLTITIYRGKLSMELPASMWPGDLESTLRERICAELEGV